MTISHKRDFLFIQDERQLGQDAVTRRVLTPLASWRNAMNIEIGDVIRFVQRIDGHWTGKVVDFLGNSVEVHFNGPSHSGYVTISAVKCIVEKARHAKAA